MPRQDGLLCAYANLVKLVYAILDHKGVCIDEFEKARLAKRDTRGEFTNRLFLKYVIESK